ncbi:MAG: arylesterase [Gammaproteobacteria bacterium]|jgi:acyl-CoA thioesterase-1
MAVRVAVVLWLIQLVATPVSGAAPTIVVLGDSLSSGYGLGAAPSWVTILEDHLEQQAYEYDVVNASISGDTSTGGLSRLPRLLDRYSPAVVIIELGGNDGLRGQPISLLRTNLSRIIELVAQMGAKPLLTGIQIPPNLGPAYTEQFADVYHQLAEQYDIAFVEFLMDGVALDASKMQPDRMHPNGSGQRPMFENVWAVLSEILD